MRSAEYATRRANDKREDNESFDGIDQDADPPRGLVSRANDILHLNEYDPSSPNEIRLLPACRAENTGMFNCSVEVEGAAKHHNT